MEPLRIRAYMRTPVIGDRWLPLDGILLFQTVRRQQGGLPAATLAGEANSGVFIPIPVAMEMPGTRDWFWKCSWAQWSDDVEGQDHWAKRFDVGLAYMLDRGQRKRIPISRGRYKAYRMPVFYRATRWIDWYCVGDWERIEELLSTVTHLGKKRVQGWGRVLRWEVIPWERDCSVECDGKLMRGVPVSMGLRSGTVARYGLRPSYYDHRNQRALVMPE